MSLSLANKAINTHRAKNEYDIHLLCQKIATHFQPAFAQHFLTEEETLFAPLMRLVDRQNQLICKQLIQEHQDLIELSLSLSAHTEKLSAFGELLKQHTRLEDRVIFPNIVLMSKDERQRVLAESTEHAALLRFF